MAISKLSPTDYQRLRWVKFVEQDYRCADCGRPVSYAEFDLHHSHSRGFGSGFREDLDVNNRGLCRDCHREADKHRESKWTEKRL